MILQRNLLQTVHTRCDNTLNAMKYICNNIKSQQHQFTGGIHLAISHREQKLQYS